ncbi:MAG: ABC transporter permease [Bdellovibrionales bacterium]|nr:ABC transporter permease [Bdellovibrionales bacterium]
MAIRHLVARKKQTTLTLLGIVFGSMAFVAISGFMLGFQYFLLDQLINNDAHIRISAREDRVDHEVANKDLYSKLDKNGLVSWVVDPSGTRSNPKIENPQGWAEILKKDPRVEAYSPQFSAQVLFSVGAIAANGKLIGSEPDMQVRVTNIQSYIKTGKFEDISSGGNRIIVGTGLLKKLGSGDGSTIFVYNGRDKPVPFKVIGTFETGGRQIDDTTAFGALIDVQKLAGQPNEINNMAVRLIDFNRARETAHDWQPLSPDKVESWDEINAAFLNVFRIQDAMRYMMIATILLVAGFGIYNILNVVVTQKKKEIAILRFIGYEPGDILQLFFLQGIILGVVGSIIGLILGYIACLGIEQISFGGGPMGGGTMMKVSFDPMIYLRAFLFGSLAAAFASLMPARSAGKLTPIDIIRSGAE